ncbi:lasso peptide biosynthesis B2 protein [Edaphobacter sp. HDX4]|uniref:lasso peptide biosynthesis B2 protein n=1 Tax=Edaphobacter sp. HDX4 TaxID=2794064 RepID=UPI002FE666A3
MKTLVIKGWFLLLYLEFLMCVRSFNALNKVVLQRSVRTTKERCHSPEQLCHAIDLACVLYFKPVMCLQRSAAATLLLRSQGLKAELVIGAQLLPFRSHAWVEIDGYVVNDKPYVSEIYSVLQRC